MRQIISSVFLFVAILFSTMLFSQVIDSIAEGEHYYIVSPNGRYFTGPVNEGPAVFYDITKNRISSEEYQSLNLVDENGMNLTYALLNTIVKILLH